MSAPKLAVACDGPITKGPRKGRIARGTSAGYERHKKAGEEACRPCLDAVNVRNTKWRTENEYDQKQAEARWRAANPDKIRAKHLRNYNLTPDEYDAMLERQNHRCAICGTDKPGAHGRFQVDHDHNCCPEPKTSCGDCVRGLLCVGCNNRLAVLENDAFVKAATTYLEDHR